MTVSAMLYYTDRVDALLANSARGVQGKHTEFATDYLSDVSQGDDSRTSIRLVAWQRPGTDLWQVERYTMLGANLGHKVKKERETKSDLCFFDALEYCAKFQMVQKEIGKIDVRAAGADKIATIREAARAAGQVIDEDGSLHLCAFGRILDDGLFSAEDIATARQTLKQTGLVVSKAQSNAALDMLRVSGDAAIRQGEKDPIRMTGDGNGVIADYKAAIHTGTNMVDAFFRAVDAKFKAHPVGTTAILALTGVFTAGYAPAKWLWQGQSEIMPVKGFHMAKSRFLKTVQNLPDEQDRLKLSDFARSVEIAFRMEQAATFAKKDLTKRSAGDVKKALAHAAAACQIANYNEADTERVKRSVSDGNVSVQQFYREVAREWSPSLTENFTLFKDDVLFNWADLYRVIKGVVDENPDSKDKYAMADKAIKYLQPDIRAIIKSASFQMDERRLSDFFIALIKSAMESRGEASLVSGMNERIKRLSISGVSPP